MASPALTFKAVSDVGRGREQNEDACGEVETAGGELLVVCDGMGGHESGEVASAIAVEAIMQIFQNSPATDPAERLKNGFLVANQRILAHADKAGLDGMGTTAVAAFVRDGEAWIGHVGDSRCYHLRGGDLLWRTADHTRVQKMIERGILTPEQAKTHEDANVVTRALGFARGEEQPEPDIASGRELREGDLLLLCSDGLYDLVNDEEIAELGSEDTPAEAAQRLVDLANRRGGHDNITVTILRWGEAAAKKGGPRKTDLDVGGPAVSAMKTTDVAKSAAAAHAIVAKERAKEAAAGGGDAQRSRKALFLVLGGLALVAIAVAVFMMTRGGGDPPSHPAVRDAGAGAIQNGSQGGSEGGSASAAGGDAGTAASGDGGSLTAPVWDTQHPDRPHPKKPGTGSGSGTGAGSGSGSGSGSASGSGSGPGSGTGSATSTGSGGFVGKLTGGKGPGSGSAAPPTTPPTTTPPTAKPSTTTPPVATPPAAQPATQKPAGRPSSMPTTPPGMTPPNGSGQ